jgi:hypothetical protein
MHQAVLKLIELQAAYRTQTALQNRGMAESFAKKFYSDEYPPHFIGGPK